MQKKSDRSNFQDQIRTLNQSLQELQVLNKLALAISSTMELNTITNTILNETIKLTGADHGSILLNLENQDQQFTTLIRSGSKTSRDKLQKFSRTIAGWVLQNQASLFCNQLDQDVRFKGITLLGLPVKAVVAVPIKLRGKILGVLILHKKPGTDRDLFTENDLRLLNIVASQSAHVLENARLLHKLQEENRYLKSQVERHYSFEEIIGRGAAMQRVFKTLEKIIPTDARVVIEGESGTGKELIARAIHFNGPRKHKPFLALDCGTLPENLLESELFGHVKGAFTGATESKKGLFQAADGGTLFLDEINNTSPALQAKLLRAIQESEVRPVGSTRPQKVDVRIICASSKNLAEAVQEGTFREDLYFRLNVVTIRLPSLRERPEDIPILAHHFLQKFNKLYNKNLKSLTPDVLHLFNRYEWPGNVRELENTIERCVILADPRSEVVDVDLLPEVIREVLENKKILPTKKVETLNQAVEELERQMIVEALQRYNGNRTRAARSLGLSRRGLLNKIERYGLG